jgi:hypothetical protein
MSTIPLLTAPKGTRLISPCLKTGVLRRGLISLLVSNEKNFFHLADSPRLSKKLCCIYWQAGSKASLVNTMVTFASAQYGIVDTTAIDYLHRPCAIAVLLEMLL